MNYWWTSDYHFSHTNIIRYCNRPFETAEEMNEVIIRGRNRGKNFLKIADNGEGIPKDKDGQPNFKHAATHICDSIKRQLKKKE